MSAVEVNDENRGVCPGGKHNSCTADIFSLDQPTGRPSILRQTENLQSTSLQKGMKTPRRDPVTKRILSPSKSVKMDSLDECTKAMQSLQLDMSTTVSEDVFDSPKPERSFFPDDVVPIKSYQLEFDNFDATNPIEGCCKMELSPAANQISSLMKTPENIPEEEVVNAELALDETLPFIPSVENSLADISSSESSVVTVATVYKLPAVEELNSPEESQHANAPSDQDQEGAPDDTPETPLPARGSYNLDFDNLNTINPFQTGGSKIPTSPVLGGDDQKPLNLSSEDTVGSAVPASAAEGAPIMKEAPIKLEFNFDVGNEGKQKPPPKRLRKRLQGGKAKEVTSTAKASQKPDDAAAKSLYSLDTDKFDNPHFNPFGTKSAVTNSPKGISVPTEITNKVPTTGPVEEAVSPVCIYEGVPPVQPTIDATVDDLFPQPKPPVQIIPKISPLPQIELNSHDIMEFNEEFVPGTTFMANDFDEQIDYLEQFGSSNFKESALRKHSLYLKFDPLVMESPKKCAEHIPLPAAFASRCETTQISEENAKSFPQKGFLLLDDAATPTSGLEIPIPRFPQPATTEDAIIEVLKYSQKDMDATIGTMEAEVKEKEEQWRAKCDKLHDDTQEMRKIIAEFELEIAKILADQEKEKEAAKAKLSDVSLEKEQVSSDLNAMERSFSELFKRLEKYKSVIEGYKKNEETLKACAQDYLTRIRKEEERYQTLKAHAEEKIGLANGEIAEVRSKFKAEVSTLQAHLRREQLKVHSLEKSLTQKDKDVEDLTKLCDELISNVQKG